ncbi:MAG: nitrogen fixation protein FixH [Limimaricola sp.]|uniref:FixH family protein n=1 Tax=Limimaricola sp. TaxID=2211665 RepID=UPI001DE87752|nr:FixH family protein [Limimaricola sp.]MBI1418788.1 nitrogen fixation protein FixH [Limimaricola sp.]
MFSAPITGPKFFAIFSSFFIVIIAVNIVMAYEAVHTFPGLETADSYSASQTFDQERAAQLALGWTVKADVHEGHLVIAITDRNGNPVEAKSLTGIFSRPTEAVDDQTPVFTFDGKVYRGEVRSGPGQWNFRMVATAADGTRFHQRVVVLVD